MNKKWMEDLCVQMQSEKETENNAMHSRPLFGFRAAQKEFCDVTVHFQVSRLSLRNNALVQ